MVADIHVTEKSFGSKNLMNDVKFSIEEREKIGLIGRNGVGKSTLFGVLAGSDKDFTGEVIFRRGTSVVATAQEHHNLGETTVLEYVLAGLPEYAKLKRLIDELPQRMGDDLRLIGEYTEALARFDDKGFYQIEEKIERELAGFQLEGVANRPLSSLSGGQKRLVEVVKIMHSQADLALIDEPTNHMDYVAKKQFIDWMSQAPEAMLVITHDRDVLARVDRIVELKDGTAVSFKGNYEAYLKQNAHSTGTAMTDYELTQRRITNLRAKVLQFRRLKEKARDPDTIKQFKRREVQAAGELAELEKIAKPTFWVDKTSVEGLDYKTAERYKKYKARNIRMSFKDEKSRSRHVLVSARDLSLGYGSPLFSSVNIDLREGEALELRGRNGAGKTTLVKALLGSSVGFFVQSAPHTSAENNPGPGDRHAQIFSEDVIRGEAVARTLNMTVFAGELALDKNARVGVYEQEIDDKYLDFELTAAIERMYLDKNLSISDGKVRRLCADYLFTEADLSTPLSRLSGGQKARFQIISMLANDPQLLILDEPTNHLDLPSIEELETALEKYTGAVLYISHDNYFRQKIGGEVVQIGAN